MCECGSIDTHALIHLQSVQQKPISLYVCYDNKHKKERTVIAI